MNVLHVINDVSTIGGAERLVVDMARHTTDFEVGVLTWRSVECAPKRLLENDAVSFLPLRPLSPKKIKAARRMIDAADVIHVHLFPSLYLSTFLRKPKVFTEHNTWNGRRRYPVLRPLERLIYKRFQRIAAISPEVADALDRWLAPHRAAITVVENGVDLTRFRPRPRSLESKTRVTLGMTASFTDQKDQDCIVRALAHLPERFVVRFAGVGPTMEAVRRIAGELNLAPRVEFLNAIDWIPRFLDELDLYIQSSHWEGFGLAALEAMASGLPAIASDVGGLREVIGSEDCLFPVGDDRALADRIARITASDSVYSAASSLSLERSKVYSIQRTVDEYAALYREIAREA